MFDLNREIDAWTESVHAGACREARSVAELRDHLHCEVETLVREGMSEEQAFRTATERMGEVEALAAEHSKNRNPVSRWFHQIERSSRRMDRRKAGLLNIGISLLFAAAILLSSYLMRGSENSQTVMFLLIGLWWIPFSYLSVSGRRGSGKSGDGCSIRPARSLGRN